MSIHFMSREGDSVRVEGSADHLATENLPPGDGRGFQCVMIGGLTVTRIGDGQHDGEAARVFTLSDETQLHEIGRLVVMHAQDLEWYEVYETSDLAQGRVDRWKTEKKLPPVAETIPLEMVTHPGESLLLAMANVAAEYGVSIRLSDPHAGQHHPEVIVSGLREKVIKALESGWGFEDDDRDYYLNG